MATYGVERRDGVVVDVFLDLLVGDLRRRARKGACQRRSSRRTEAGQPGRREWSAVLADTYTIGIRVTHVEKVVRVRRVRLGFKSILDRVCAADTHRKSHSANQDVHVVFRREETVAVRVSRRDTRARYRLLWIDDGLIVHARRLDGDSPNAFRLQN